MKGKLFGRTNPNDLLFNVETQEGSEILDGDEGVASIGDATMNHILGLSGIEKMAYDEFVQVRDGNIFKVVENTRFEDMTITMPGNQQEAEQKIAKRTAQLETIERDLVREASSISPNQRKVKALLREKEIIEEELDVLEAYNADDLMGHRESLIPYEDWEKFGGMSAHWDIPATPRPKLDYVGNSRQPFYDDFPEDHPLAGLINRVIITLDGFEHHQIMTRAQITDHNKDNPKKKILRVEDGPSYIYSDEESDFLCANEYVEYLRRTVMSINNVDIQYRTSTYEALSNCVMVIADGKIDPVEAVSNMLKRLDTFHFNAYKFVSAVKTKKSDPLYAHLCVYGRQLLTLAKRGKNVYNELKTFGRELYKDGFLAMKNMKPGELCTKSCDQAGCQIQEPGHALAGVRGVVQHPRPHHWDKYHAIRREIEDLLEKRKNASQASSVVKKCIDRMQQVRDVAVESRNLQKFTSVSNALIKAQKQGKLNLSPVEWGKIWATYNTYKQEVTQHLSRGNT